MLSGGKEVIIGMVRDPTFGPMLMFWLGGVYVEILKDVRFAITPVGESEARERITGIKLIRSLPDSSAFFTGSNDLKFNFL